MSVLRIEKLTISAAEVGPDNPLPPLQADQDIHVELTADSTVPEEDREHLGYGSTRGCLPYALQNGYGRRRQPRDFTVAVLENGLLRATFLLESGGRLWSLFDKTTGRELVHVNPVFQPANLALRGAWVSGGVEWNMGVIGHGPHTCAPVFAARVRADDGTPVLRLYEWERIRQAPYQLDAYLPDGSPVLFARVRLVNPHDRVIPMYWWSNIAVDEKPGMRVLAPAEAAYRFGYGGALSRIPVPVWEGVDVTRPHRITDAADFFFVVADPRRPWISAVDGEGRGVAQMSTRRLQGRKLFVWGMGPGGRRWQEFLSVRGSAYLEIQAGLARTQSGCLPMPARAEWSWLEAYGPLTADPVVMHGEDWAGAYRHVEQRLDEVLRADLLEAELERSSAMADRPPEELLHRGSGWGALERRRRERSGERPFCSGALVFDDSSLSDAQSPWMALLSEGALPCSAPSRPPGAFMVQAEWRKLLEAAVEKGRGAHWLSWLHLGVMRCLAGDPRHAGEVESARQAWERSLELDPSPWALRNLAVLAKWDGAKDQAADLWLAAARLCPQQLSLVVECGSALLEAGRPRAWAEFLATLAPPVLSAGRVRMLEARAALALGELETVEKILLSDLVVPDLREGELSLSKLWFEMQEKRLAAEENAPIDEALRQRVRREFPPPSWLDFRMEASAGTS